MFEKIKAWIKRKRETAREQQAADRLIKHIEQALGFELYEWQRLYIAGWFRHEIRSIYEQLRAAGVPVREMITEQQRVISW